MTRLIHDLLIKSTNKFPNKEAVYFKNISFNYERIYTESNALSNFLIKSQIKKGDRISFFLEKRLEKVISIFGISMCSGVMVPIRKLTYPHQVAYIINNSGSRILITTQSKLNSIIGEFLDQMKSLECIIVLDLQTENTKNLPKRIKIISWSEIMDTYMTDIISIKSKVDKDIAAILYTSGSTGNPKGVILSHLNIVEGAKRISEYLKMTENDTLLSILSFGFDYGLNQLTSTFYRGGKIVLLDSLFNNDIIKTIQKYNITGLAAVATTWIQLLQSKWDQENMPTLRYITNSGGAIPEVHVKELRRRLPNTEIYLMYGLTEAFRSTYLDPTLVDKKPTSIGRAVPGEEVVILTDRNLVAKPGEIGEIVHHGVLVAKGYWQDPELTNIRYRPYPLQESEIPVKEMAVFSGDYAYYDEDGDMYFVGRKDEMIKSAGYRISPTEIEEIIYKINDVKDVVVMGVPDEVKGSAILVIVSAINKNNLSEHIVYNHCKQFLPHYMLPDYLELMDELPKNTNGKLDRSKLKKIMLNKYEKSK